MRNRIFAVLGVIFVVWTALAALPHPAVAQLLPGDPTSVVKADYLGWVAKAQQYARDIYMFLFIFEVIALAITTLLFRENLPEFFASIGFKCVLGGLFFWLIQYGPTLAQKVIGWFEQIGSNDFGGSASPLYLVTGCLAAAAAFFTAAGIAHTEQTALTTTLGLPPVFCTWYYGFGTCPMGAISVAATSHATFILLSQGLGVMIIMAALGIFLQFAIVTIESYLVMSVGVLMVGFAGSRFTFPFSQGYFSYMINVGVKLMVTYIILGVAATQLVKIILLAALTLGAAALIPFGVTDAYATGAAAVAAVYVVLTAGLVWTIPAFTAALLSGQSQSSGFSILQQAVGSFAGAAQMFAQMGAAGRAGASAETSRTQMSEVQQAHAQGAGGAATAGGLTSQAMSPSANIDRFAGSAPQTGGALGGIGVGLTTGSGPSLFSNGSTNSAPASLSDQGGGGFGGPINPSNGQSYGSGGGSAGDSSYNLYSSTPQQIERMNSGEAAARLQNTDFSSLSEPQQAMMEKFHAKETEAVLGEKAANADERADLSRAYGLSGLAQAAPRDIGQPSAVQVRMSNPDKL